MEGTEPSPTAPPPQAGQPDAPVSQAQFVALGRQVSELAQLFRAERRSPVTMPPPAPPSPPRAPPVNPGWTIPGPPPAPTMDFSSPHLSRYLSPFSPDILAVRPPPGFRMPQMDRYDGTTDPNDHLASFEALMQLHGLPDAVMCIAFQTTLRGPARTWFSHLPDGSIRNFHQLSREFVNQAASQPVPPPMAELHGPPVSQAQFAAFQNLLDVLSQQVARLTYVLLTGRQLPAPGPLPPPTPTIPTTLGAARSLPSARQGRAAPYNCHRRPRPRSHAPPPRTPAETLRRAHAAGGYCDYHREHGHDTDECRRLRNDVEGLVRSGHLRHYVDSQRMISEEAATPRNESQTPEGTTPPDTRDRPAEVEADQPGDASPTIKPFHQN